MTTNNNRRVELVGQKKKKKNLLTKAMWKPVNRELVQLQIPIGGLTLHLGQNTLFEPHELAEHPENFHVHQINQSLPRGTTSIKLNCTEFAEVRTAIQSKKYHLIDAQFNIAGDRDYTKLESLIEDLQKSTKPGGLHTIQFKITDASRIMRYEDAANLIGKKRRHTAEMAKHAENLYNAAEKERELLRAYSPEQVRNWLKAHYEENGWQVQELTLFPRSFEVQPRKEPPALYLNRNQILTLIARKPIKE